MTSGFVSNDGEVDFKVRVDFYDHPHPKIKVTETFDHSKWDTMSAESGTVYAFCAREESMWKIYIGETGSDLKARTAGNHRGKDLVKRSEVIRVFSFNRRFDPWNTDARKTIEDELTQRLKELAKSTKELEVLNSSGSFFSGANINTLELNESVDILFSHIVFALALKIQSQKKSLFDEEIETISEGLSSKRVRKHTRIYTDDQKIIGEGPNVGVSVADFLSKYIDAFGEEELLKYAEKESWRWLRIDDFSDAGRPIANSSRLRITSLKNDSSDKGESQTVSSAMNRLGEFLNIKIHVEQEVPRSGDLTDAKASVEHPHGKTLF